MLPWQQKKSGHGAVSSDKSSYVIVQSGGLWTTLTLDVEKVEKFSIGNLFNRVK